MTSEVSICNLALDHIGAGNIESLEEGSEEARRCKLTYPVTRDALLRVYPWGFAKKTIVLAESGTPAAPWAYRYAWPDDCLRARYIVPDDPDDDPIPYEKAVADDLKSVVIDTDRYQASLVYTAAVTLPLLFDSLFVVELSWQLASDLAPTLAKSEAREKKAYERATQFLSITAAVDASEVGQRPQREAEWVRGR